MNLIFLHLKNLIIYVIGVQIANPTVYYFLDQVIELLIVDLTGPMSVSTWDGYLYTLVIVKVSFHYVVDYLLKKKEKASIAIQDIIAMIEHQSGLKACQL